MANRKQTDGMSADGMSAGGACAMAGAVGYVVYLSKQSGRSWQPENQLPPFSVIRPLIDGGLNHASSNKEKEAWTEAVEGMVSVLAIAESIREEIVVIDETDVEAEVRSHETQQENEKPIAAILVERVDAERIRRFLERSGEYIGAESWWNGGVALFGAVSLFPFALAHFRRRLETGGEGAREAISSMQSLVRDIEALMNNLEGSADELIPPSFSDFYDDYDDEDDYVDPSRLEDSEAIALAYHSLAAMAMMVKRTVDAAETEGAVDGEVAGDFAALKEQLQGIINKRGGIYVPETIREFEEYELEVEGAPKLSGQAKDSVLRYIHSYNVSADDVNGYHADGERRIFLAHYIRAIGELGFESNPALSITSAGGTDDVREAKRVIVSLSSPDELAADVKSGSQHPVVYPLYDESNEEAGVATAFYPGAEYYYQILVPFLAGVDRQLAASQTK